jgi:hypothetical protein
MSQDTINNDLYFTAPTQLPNVENTKNASVNSTAQEAAFFFGADSPKKPSSPTVKSPQQTTATQSIFAKLVENPSLLNIPSFNQTTTQNIHRPISQRRDVPLYYVTEIAQFTDKQVEGMFLRLASLTCIDGLKTRIDNTTGDLYGPHPDYPFGSMFSSREELSKIHSNVSENCSYPSGGGPATSVLLLDISPHDDRGNIALFVGEQVRTTEQVPPLTGSNQALHQCLVQKTAFRVIRGHEDIDTQVSTHVPVRRGYRYDGMYFVGDYWYEQIEQNLFQYVFKLVRLYGQPQLLAVTELYRSIFPPTEKIINEEAQRYGINPNVGTFFPSVVTSQTMMSPMSPLSTAFPVSSNAKNAIHAILQQHKMNQQKQVIQRQQQSPQNMFQQQFFPVQQQPIQQQQKPIQQQGPTQQGPIFQQPQLTPVFQQPNLQPVIQPSGMPQYNPNTYVQFQEQQRQLQQQRRPQVRAPTQLIRGMDLSPGPVREMLTQLRRKNAGTSTRLSEMQEEIDQVEIKNHTPVQKPKGVTSRNKSFYWNQKRKRQEEEKANKRRKDDLD